jgi:phage tail-like protein
MHPVEVRPPPIPHQELAVTDETRDASWAVPKFSFSVDIDGVAMNLPFQEMTGIDVIEYRRGDSRLSTTRTPGIQRAGNITLKKGIFAKDNKFFDWYKRIKLNAAPRSTVTIRLLDENGNPTMTWTLRNAWPAKFASADLNAAGNEVAVETLELAHEGLTVANG